jgi:hypothetical protein
MGVWYLTAKGLSCLVQLKDRLEREGIGEEEGGVDIAPFY